MMKEVTLQKKKKSAHVPTFHHWGPGQCWHHRRCLPSDDNPAPSQTRPQSVQCQSVGSGCKRRRHIQSSHAFNLCSIHTSSNNTQMPHSILPCLQTVLNTHLFKQYPNATFNPPMPSNCVKYTPLQTTPQQTISSPFSPFVLSDGLPAPRPQRWSLLKDHDSAPMRGCGHCHYPHFIVSSQDVQANAKWLSCSEYHARVTFSCSNLHDMTNFVTEIL